MFFTIRRSVAVVAAVAAIATLIGCSSDNLSGINPVSSDNNTGAVSVNITLERTGLSKSSAIVMDFVQVCFFDQVKWTYDTIYISSTTESQTVGKTYGGFLGGINLLIGVNSWDKEGKIIHNGSATQTIVTGDTIDFNFNILPRYGQLISRICSLPDSATKAELYVRTINSSGPVSPETYDSIVFPKGTRDTAVLRADLPLMYSSSGAQYVRLRVYGDNGPGQSGVVLFEGDTTISPKPGVDESASIIMRLINGPPTGGAAVNAVLGKVGIFRLDGVVP